MAITIQHTILDGNVGGTYEDAVAYAKFLEQQWQADCADEDETVAINIDVWSAEGSRLEPKIYGDLRRSTLTDENLVWERWIATLNDEQRDRVEGAI